jgi:hypothetical protein
MHTSTKAISRLGSLALLALGSCGDDSPGRWTLTMATATARADEHVVVDVTYINDGEENWNGSRCVAVEWQKGTIQTREEARQGLAATATIVEGQRYCNGGNKALRANDRDLFEIVSVRTRADLVGTTIVVVAEDTKGTPTDDRVLIPSP